MSRRRHVPLVVLPGTSFTSKSGESCTKYIYSKLQFQMMYVVRVLGELKLFRSPFQCVFSPGRGLHPGGYNCTCKSSFYFPPSSSNSVSNAYSGEMIEVAYIQSRDKMNDAYNVGYQCVPCASGCAECLDDTPCAPDYDVLIRGISLGVECFCMAISIVIGFVIIRLRKTKVRSENDQMISQR